MTFYDPCQNGNKNNKADCNPECLLNSECDDSKACVSHTCEDPCHNTCGINSVCRVQSHTAICSCMEGYYGDALVQCSIIPPDRDVTTDPCKTNPSPCPPNVKCFSYDNKVAICDDCAAPENFNNFECKPQCTSDSQCPGNMACINFLCVDPCAGSCGSNSFCDVISHKPICRCIENTIGNPYDRCVYPTHEESEPKLSCGEKICGENTDCSQRGKVFKCVCKKDFYGDALIGCHPECRINSDCPFDKACMRNKCVNPCNENICGLRATCEVRNHRGVCSCRPGLTGNAYLECSEISRDTPIVAENPCGPPTPCGSYSKCQISGNFLTFLENRL